MNSFVKEMEKCGIKTTSKSFDITNMIKEYDEYSITYNIYNVGHIDLIHLVEMNCHIKNKKTDIKIYYHMFEDYIAKNYICEKIDIINLYERKFNVSGGYILLELFSKDNLLMMADIEDFISISIHDDYNSKILDNINRFINKEKEKYNNDHENSK